MGWITDAGRESLGSDSQAQRMSGFHSCPFGSSKKSAVKIFADLEIGVSTSFGAVHFLSSRGDLRFGVSSAFNSLNAEERAAEEEKHGYINRANSHSHFLELKAEADAEVEAQVAASLAEMAAIEVEAGQWDARIDASRAEKAREVVEKAASEKRLAEKLAEHNVSALVYDIVDGFLESAMYAADNRQGNYTIADISAEVAEYATHKEAASILAFAAKQLGFKESQLFSAVMSIIE